MPRGCLKKPAKRIAQIFRNALEPSAVSRLPVYAIDPSRKPENDQFSCCWSAATFSSARLTSDFLPLPTARSFFCRRRFKSAASSSAFSRWAVAAADSFVAATNAALAISSSLCGNFRRHRIGLVAMRHFASRPRAGHSRGPLPAAQLSERDSPPRLSRSHRCDRVALRSPRFSLLSQGQSGFAPGPVPGPLPVLTAPGPGSEFPGSATAVRCRALRWHPGATPLPPAKMPPGTSQAGRRGTASSG